MKGLLELFCDIDRVVRLEQPILREFFKRVCSFVRDDLLISVVLPFWRTTSSYDIRDLWTRALIPVEASILTRTKILDITSEGIQLCVLNDVGQPEECRSKVFANALERPCLLARSMQWINREIREKLGECAFVLGPIVESNAYSYEEGLMLA